MRLNGNRALVTVGDVSKMIDARELDLSDEKAVLARFAAQGPRRPPAPVGLRVDRREELRKARRQKLREIAAQVTAARDRGFSETDKYTPAKGLELGRQVDIVLLYLLGDLKNDDLIWTRNWWTGHQEQIDVATWLESMRQGFKLRQCLRQHEQELRQQVEDIFSDESMTQEGRIEELNKFNVEPFLDIAEETSLDEVEEKLQARKTKRTQG